jgi:hypothetical protein
MLSAFPAEGHQPENCKIWDAILHWAPPPHDGNIHGGNIYGGNDNAGSSTDLPGILNGIKHRHQLQTAKDALDRWMQEHADARDRLAFLERVLLAHAIKDGVFVALGNLLCHHLIHADTQPPGVVKGRERMQHLVLLNYVISRKQPLNEGHRHYCLPDTWTAVRLYLRLFGHVPIDNLMDIVDWNVDYAVHLNNSHGQVDSACFCRFPAVVPLAAKQALLQVESQHGMRQQLQDAFFRTLFERQPQRVLWTLNVRRHHILHDAAQELLNPQYAKRPHEYRKQLRVHFVGEEGVDEGGLLKDFFGLLQHDLLHNPRLFRTINDDRHLWLSISDNDDLGGDSVLAYYRLVGLILALAIYNGLQVDVSFAPVLYKLLLEHAVHLTDLDPNWRDLSPEDEAECRRLFLPPRPIASMLEGFRLVFPAGSSLLYSFAASDVEHLLRGKPVVDWPAIRDNCRYEHGYTAESPVILWLWDIVLDLLDDAERRAFLLFVTGSDRLPIVPSASRTNHALSMLVVRAGPCADRLPTTQTCFNTLLLNEYSSRAKLERYLRLALQHARTDGFGLC